MNTYQISKLTPYYQGYRVQKHDTPNLWILTRGMCQFNDNLDMTNPKFDHVILIKAISYEDAFMKLLTQNELFTKFVPLNGDTRTMFLFFMIQHMPHLGLYEQILEALRKNSEWKHDFPETLEITKNLYIKRMAKYGPYYDDDDDNNLLCESGFESVREKVEQNFREFERDPGRYLIHSGCTQTQIMRLYSDILSMAPADFVQTIESVTQIITE